MPDFSTRSNDIEIMDDLNCQGEVVDQTLRELEVINKLLGGNYVTIDGIEKLLKNKNESTPISICDLGCGGGDILKLIAQWASRKNKSLKLTGIDANPNIIRFANDNCKAYPQIEFEAVDIFSDQFESRKYDIIIGTLFFHHFSSEQLASFFKQIRNQAVIGIVINDIHRHWFAYHSIKFLTRIFSKSAMVRFDAPLSVLRAFKKRELIQIMQQAGIENYTIKWMWAFRWQLCIKTLA
ncbi:MAG TPA: methyltransferase domain-containing protein [Cyclobacteriaceae bacterium]|nr:methyltransferase domain-containing protein [Cyclobacteriaceae bacterium]